MLKESDAVTLHVPLTSDTEHMISAPQLAKMKPTATLINTSRGKVVDEMALVDALKNMMIAEAELDVFEKEPLPMNSPLIEQEDIVLTPHIAFLEREDVCRREAAERSESISNC